MKNLISTIPKEELQELLNKFSTIVEILKYLGVSCYNGNHRTLNKRILREGLDMTVFKENHKKWRTGFLKRVKKVIPEEDIFIEDSKYKSRFQLKKRLMKLGREYICEICHIPGEYNGKPLSLQLDHINGVNNDNRLENLRFLCPNCHSQTETFSGKKHIKRYYCLCGNEIWENGRKCRSCAQKRREWPSPEELTEMLENLSMSEIGRRLNVSFNAVKKHCQKRGIVRPL